MIQKIDPHALVAAYHPENGFFNQRILDDGTIIACHRLMYTTALVINIDSVGYEYRYCYPTRELAVAACNQLRDADDQPLDGFIASRGSGAYSPADGRSRHGLADRGNELHQREHSAIAGGAETPSTES